MEMVFDELKKFEGMKLKYVSGRLEENPDGRSIGYTVTFDMTLDFTRFVDTANKFIPGYLNNGLNAIRPVFDGLAYHLGYNYFADKAGRIHTRKALFDIFTGADNYMDEWSGSDFQQRYVKPVFEVGSGAMRITARNYFRWQDEKRRIEIADLPTIRFQWGLNLMVGHTKEGGPMAPSSVVLLMYPDVDEVEVDGIRMYRGMRYMKCRELSFGNISSRQILTAR